MYFQTLYVCMYHDVYLGTPASVNQPLLTEGLGPFKFYVLYSTSACISYITTGPTQKSIRSSESQKFFHSDIHSMRIIRDTCADVYIPP